MTLMTAVGMMSGTSMDGIDLAMLRTDGEGFVERGRSHFVPYEAAFRRRIERALDEAKAIKVRTERPGDLAALEREITMRHAVALRDFLARLEVTPDIVGFHGQTVLHRPGEGLTVQLGDGELLAQAVNLPVVHDMRAKDMEHGGQGAPLVPAYHRALARTRKGDREGVWPVCFVNVGGISNVSFVPETGDPIAFDSGPGNALIDQWVAREGGVPFDQDGRIASEGGVVIGVVDRYLAKPFFAKAGPKSLDRNDFTLKDAEGMELADGARTLAHVSAAAIFRAAEHMPEPPRLWIVCGGGRKNPYIVADMQALAGEEAVILAEDAGFDGDAMEAEAWAFLAVRSLEGLPLTWPSTTGCDRPTVGGVLSRP